MQNGACALGRAQFVRTANRAISTSRVTALPHAGQKRGISNGFSFPVRFSGILETISGMMSPAFCTTTVSPMRISRSRIMSKLCSVARETVEPARRTGSRTAFGVRTPVRPTCTVISSNFVCFCSGGYLYATAHFGVTPLRPRGRAYLWNQFSPRRRRYRTQARLEARQAPRSAPGPHHSRASVCGAAKPENRVVQAGRAFQNGCPDFLGPNTDRPTAN